MLDNKEIEIIKKNVCRFINDSSIIKEKTGMETAAIVATLSLLELKGHIRNFGDRYQKITS